jgi:capsular exopolysaccharide synthesis family protein
MEPLDYIKILQRHWKVVVGLISIVIVAVFFLAPAAPAPVYEAKHTLLREVASSTEGGVSSADNPQVVALWAGAGEVPNRVKEALGYTGPVDDLTSRLLVTPNIETGTVELIATADSKDEAVLLVNTFAEQTIAFIEERDAARVQEARDEATARATELQADIAELESQIEARGGETDPRAASLVNQRSALDGELAVARSGANVTVSTEWTSLQAATSASQQAASVVGLTRGKALVLGALVSVLMAFGVAIMLDRSDSRLHTKDQAERQFGLPVLAEVPLLSIRSRHKAAVFGYHHDHRVAEAYRSLRTALLLFRDRLPLEVEAAELSGRRGGRGSSSARQVILVTSPEAGDGKSSTAANLAIAYAEAGQSVLLVNWDLWRPIPARVFDAEDAPGVSEFLEAGNASLVRFVQSTSVPGLHLVPAGKLGHQPGAQLDAELRLLEEARALADVVIIDTAPLLGASVTRELVTMADVVILASRAGRTTSPAAERTSELLERLGAPTLGVVLVGVPTGLFNDYYGNPPSRSERLRNSMLSRSEPSRPRYASQSGSADSMGHASSATHAPPPPGFGTSAGPVNGGNDEGDLFRAPDRLPSSGSDR